MRSLETISFDSQPSAVKILKQFDNLYNLFINYSTMFRDWLMGKLNSIEIQFIKFNEIVALYKDTMVQTHDSKLTTPSHSSLPSILPPPGFTFHSSSLLIGHLFVHFSPLAFVIHLSKHSWLLFIITDTLYPK